MYSFCSNKCLSPAVVSSSLSALNSFDFGVIIADTGSERDNQAVTRFHVFTRAEFTTNKRKKQGRFIPFSTYSDRFFSRDKSQNCFMLRHHNDGRRVEEKPFGRNIFSIFFYEGFFFCPNFLQIYSNKLFNNLLKIHLPMIT
jgi:hypothetical protein